MATVIEMMQQQTEFIACLRDQLQRHPAMDSRDVCKLCYQAACGAEHLLTDHAAAWARLQQEWAETPVRDEPLYEPLSATYCRVNLGAWKGQGLPVEWLFRIFTGGTPCGAPNVGLYLDWAEPVLKSCGFSMDQWRDFRAQYESDGMPALHHSEAYRAAEQPAYRLAERRYMVLLPILQQLATMATAVIAIDGQAGAGKSTLAQLLAQVLGAGVVYMDDFFLPPFLRTAERLAEPGGNVHYERFVEQVLPYLKKPAVFSYDRFDCSVMQYNGVRQVADAPYRIVEGSYSHHPHFEDYMNLRVFVSVDAAEQMRRIRIRNGADMAERFRKEWIPMEEQYFAAYAVRNRADIIL